MSGGLEGLALRVEAILFASGKPLSAGEIAEALGTTELRAVQAGLRSLMQSYDDRATSLELRHVGTRYALQLREEFVATARVVTPMEMAPRTLKALTLIAYHQPMLQSLLVRMFGEGAYEQVQRLRGMGLVRTEPQGATLELTTTRVFAEYFGISSTKPEEIRAYLERKLGTAVAAPESAMPPPGAVTPGAPPAAIPPAEPEPPPAAPTAE